MTLREEVVAHLNEMYELEIEGVPRKRQLRASGLPYCPVLDVVVPPQPDVTDINRALYTEIGKAAHLALQLFATSTTYGPRCWGCWKCPGCGHQWTQPQFKPRTCPKQCGEPLLYEEISYKMRAMSGHSDILVRYPSGWVIQDYKTCDGKKPAKPDPVYLLQVLTYCHLLKLQHKITAQYCIVYIGRAHLERYVFGPYDYLYHRQTIADWTSRANMGFMAATRARKSPTPSNLQEVARLRPCHDRASHDEYMGRSRAFRKGPCSMLGNCSCNDAHVARMMHSLIQGE